jgi:hypothetical protein
MEPKNRIAVRPSKKPARWLSFLVLFGVILVSGSVVADVVLVFTVNHNLGANASSPFQFQGGANYVAANALGFVSNSYPGIATTTGVTVTTTISGVASVPVELFDVTEFVTSVKLPAKATYSNINVPSASTLTPANVVCAYAFVSTAVPSFGPTAVAGSPVGCSATMPTLGAVSTGCGVGATAQTAVVNLLTGAVTGTSIGTANSGCTTVLNTVALTTVLYISYAITTTGAVSATSLNAFTVPVTLQ